MQFRYLGLAAICAVLLALPAWAHHSHSNYDLTEWVEFEGTLRQMHYLNPHSFLFVEIEDEAGDSAVWTLEATGPMGIEQNGAKREDVRPGDTIGVRCHLLVDGSKGCLLGFVTPLHGDPERGHGVAIEWD